MSGFYANDIHLNENLLRLRGVPELWFWCAAIF